MFDKNNVIFMKDSYEIKNYKTEQAYSFLFFIASKIVLMDKQKEFDLITKNGYKHFAFDYYGLNSINAFYGPLKMEMIYEDKYFLIHKNP